MEVFSSQLTARQLGRSLGGSGSHGERKSAKSLTIPSILHSVLWVLLRGFILQVQFCNLVFIQLQLSGWSWSWAARWVRVLN